MRQVIALLSTLLLGACAHPINIAPRVDVQAGSWSDRSVAYVISPEDRDREISKPTAAGDSVTYAPYRDLETGIFQMLSGLYRRVTLMRSASDATLIERNGVTVLFLPRISTEVFSNNPFIWPPTGFEIRIDYRVQDTGGRELYSNSAPGTGTASFSEMRATKDHGLAGRRAAAAALATLRKQIENAPELR